MPTFYPENSQVLPSDNELRSLHKIAALGVGGASSGGGGTGDVQVYMDRAPADPDNVSIAALSYPSGGGSMQQWDINTLSWA